MGILRYRRPPPHPIRVSERDVLAAAHEIRLAEGAITFGRRERKKALEVHRFCEQIIFALAGAPRSRPLAILDGACGKSYLSLIAARLVLPRLGLQARILGVDTVERRLDACRKAAAALGLEGFEFAAGRLESVPLPERLDVVWALHACGSATDSLLTRAVAARARYVLCVPCCYQPAGAGLDELGFPQSGRLRGRLTETLRDAVRVLRLEAAGYRVDPVEFAGAEITPRNLMLRAERRPESSRRVTSARESLERLTRAFPDLA